VAVELSIGVVSRHTAAAVRCDPDATGLVDGEPVRAPSFGPSEYTPVRTAPIGLDVVHENLVAGAVALEDLTPLGRKANAIAHPDIAIELRHGTIGRDSIDLTGRLRPFTRERVEAHRPHDDPALGVGEEVIEARHVVGSEHDARLALANVADVSTGDHHPTVRVQRDSTHAASLGHDGLDQTIGRPAVHTSAHNVAEVEAILTVYARSLDQAVARRQGLDFRAEAHVVAEPA
jgi:hypothetical protein